MLLISVTWRLAERSQNPAGMFLTYQSTCNIFGFVLPLLS